MEGECGMYAQIKTHMFHDIPKNNIVILFTMLLLLLKWVCFVRRALHLFPPNKHLPSSMAFAITMESKVKRAL